MSETESMQEKMCFKLGGEHAGSQFRNGCSSRFAPHPAYCLRARKNGRTCTEGPFGEVLRATGPMAASNPFRFSTKYQDDETGLVYYGDRYLDASAGRWVSRDAIQEFGGLNVYGFCGNDCVNASDPFGKDYMPYPFPHNTTPGTPPAMPHLMREPKSDQLGCCTSDKIKQGKDDLQKKFDTASYYLSRLADPAPAGCSGATCKLSSRTLVAFLLPTPACWVCYLEQRNKFPRWIDTRNDMTDHEVIICRSYSKSGDALDETMFDWWGDAAHPKQKQSGSSPASFRVKYPYPDPDQPVIEYPSWKDCAGKCRGMKTPPKSSFENIFSS